jgi:cytochrome P450
LPSLIEDTKRRLDALATEPSGITDPFDSVYEIVFQLTMRTVGCNEVANSPEHLQNTLRWNQTIEQSSTMPAIIFPWFPSPALLRRTLAGIKMYRLFDNIIEERKRTGKKEKDALQYMIDKGDSTKDIISVCIKR